MKWIRFLCSIKWLLVKSRNNINYYWLKNVIQIVTKLIYFFLLVHFVFRIQTVPTWYQLKSFLLSLHSSIFLYTAWVTWEFIDLDPLGQIQYVVFIGKINICQSGISLHWKENMMDSSVDEEMTPVECAKVEMFCANTCLYSKHYCYYFHIHRLIFAAVKTWGSHVTHMLMQLGWDTLEQRRLLYQLSKFYKIQGGLVGISIPPAVYSRTRASRAPNAFPFRHIQSSSNVYKYSFYPSSIAA